MNAAHVEKPFLPKFCSDSAEKSSVQIGLMNTVNVKSFLASAKDLTMLGIRSFRLERSFGSTVLCSLMGNLTSNSGALPVTFIREPQWNITLPGMLTHCLLRGSASSRELQEESCVPACSHLEQFPPLSLEWEEGMVLAQM